MKKLLYFTTIIFNTIGTIMCFSLIFTFGSKYENFTTIIFISSLFFIASLTITIHELNKTTKNNVVYFHKYQKPNLTIAKNGEIIDYKNYCS